MEVRSYEELLKNHLLERVEYLEVENRLLRAKNEVLTKENKVYRERFEIDITEEEMEQQYKDYYGDPDQY